MPMMRRGAGEREQQDNPIAVTNISFLHRSPSDAVSARVTSVARRQIVVGNTGQRVKNGELVDPATLEITLATPIAPFLLNLRYIYPAQKSALDGKDLAKDPYFSKPVGFEEVRGLLKSTAGAGAG